MAEITLITGGAGSGKTAYAIELAVGFAKKAYIATAEATDSEMWKKILNHKAERDDTFVTFEEPIEIRKVITETGCGVIIIDCLTFWVNNLLYYDKDVEEYSSTLIAALAMAEVPVILVSNEVGLGIIPADKPTRRYASAAAKLNKAVADIAENVILMVAGQPLYVKGRK